jgi:ubiquinone/menaquinone biosynthesis C-methylase UbiE
MKYKDFFTLLPFLFTKSSSPRYKEIAELLYWQVINKTENGLSNSHYSEFYTSNFNLDISYFSDKIIVDIGCGPRGSLEWAENAKCCVGVDPLSDKYRRLGTIFHKMHYLTSYSEKIPLKTGICDVVSSFNSLDHVNDVEQTVREIKRVTKVGGLFLLIVEVNHNPKICEPHQIAPEKILELFKPEFTCTNFRIYKPRFRSIYKTIRKGEKFENPEQVKERGYLSASFIREVVT